jgi:anti-sigma B factor antagonist
MEMTITQRPNAVAIVRPVGRIDNYTVRAFKERIDEIIDSGYRWFVIDLGAVTFLDSTGIGALLASLRRTKDLDGDLRLAQVSYPVRMTIDLAVLHSYLARYASVADALASYP